MHLSMVKSSIVCLQKFFCLEKLSTDVRSYYVLPVVGMGPSFPSIEHGHSGITAHLKDYVCETLNLGV